MAGVPCVSDTCSIVSAIDSFGKLSLNTRLSTVGGLACGTNLDPNAGLRVALYGDPTPVSPATLTECDSLLGVTTDGLIFTKRPGFQIIPGPGVGAVPFPGGVNVFGGPSIDAANITITNSDNCSRLLIVKTTGNLNFETDSQSGYSMDAVFAVEYNPGSVFTHSISRAGQPSNPGTTGSDLHVESFSMTQFLQINGGQSINIRTYGQKLTSSSNIADIGSPDTERTNQVDTSSVISGKQMGYNADISIIKLDLAPRTLS